MEIIVLTKQLPRSSEKLLKHYFSCKKATLSKKLDFWREILKNLSPCIFFSNVIKKSRIRETKHLSTDADSSTKAIGGWTKNTPKPASYITASYLNITASCRYITASLKQAGKISKKKLFFARQF